MTLCGVRRITVGAGSATPCAVAVTAVESISVEVRLVVVLAGRNSFTLPVTVTASPAATAGLVFV